MKQQPILELRVAERQASLKSTLKSPTLLWCAPVFHTGMLLHELISMVYPVRIWPIPLVLASPNGR
jgi:hypothetical protein